MSVNPFPSPLSPETRFYEIFMNRLSLLQHTLEKAAERCRLMLYITTLGSILILIVNFNANFSWDTKINAKDRLLLSEEIKSISPLLLKEYNDQLATDLGYKDLTAFNKNSVAIITRLCDQLNSSTPLPNRVQIESALTKYVVSLYKNNLLVDSKTYVDFFIKHQQFTVPLIGLSCSVSDMFLLCSTFFIIILVYNNFNLRREEKIVFRLYKSFKYVDQKPNALSSFGIQCQDEFQELSTKEILLDTIFQGTINSFVFTEPTIKREDYWTAGVAKENTMARVIKRCMDYFPIFSLASLLFTDILSFINRREYFPNGDSTHMLTIEAIGIVAFVACYLQCRVSRKTSNNMELILDHMYRRILDYRKELKKMNNNQEPPLQETA